VNNTDRTQSLWPTSVQISFLWCRSHTFIDLSAEAETAQQPSGDTATEFTSPPWPTSEQIFRRRIKSHIIRVSSADADTAYLPSGVTAILRIEPLCPEKVINSSPTSRSHIFMVQSSDPDSTCLPSGVGATATTQSLCPERVKSSGPPESKRLGSNGHSQGALAWLYAWSNNIFSEGMSWWERRPMSWPDNCSGCGDMMWFDKRIVFWINSKSLSA